MPQNLLRAAVLALVLAAGLTPGPAAAQEYLLGPQDKLNINVYEWPDLTGEFTVGASGAVAMPMLGNVAAAGLDPQELAEEIARRLQEHNGLLETPNATVEVAEYRPFFILGDVQTPGEYPFRPGLTVLQAVSIGGGHFRYTDPELLRLEREAIASRGDLRILALQMDQYQVRRARLQAEIDGADEIAYPPEIMARAEEPDVARLIREEELLFASRRETLVEQVRTLESLIVLYESEIVSLQAQLETESRQGELLATELAGITSLVERGLARAPQQLALQRTAAEIEREERELDTYILRARQNISQAQQNILSLRSERRNDTIAELQQVQATFEEAGERVSTTQQLIFEAEVTVPMERVEADLAERAPVTYNVVRRGADQEVQEIAAIEATAVQPGDVIKVQRRSRLDPADLAAGTRTGALEPGTAPTGADRAGSAEMPSFAAQSENGR